MQGFPWVFYLYFWIRVLHFSKSIIVSLSTLVTKLLISTFMTSVSCIALTPWPKFDASLLQGPALLFPVGLSNRLYLWWVFRPRRLVAPISDRLSTINWRILYQGSGSNKSARGETNKSTKAILEMPQETCPDNFQVKILSAFQPVYIVLSQINIK